jgi:hypothetical protein
MHPRLVERVDENGNCLLVCRAVLLERDTSKQVALLQTRPLGPVHGYRQAYATVLCVALYLFDPDGLREAIAAASVRVTKTLSARWIKLEPYMPGKCRTHLSPLYLKGTCLLPSSSGVSSTSIVCD